MSRKAKKIQKSLKKAKAIRLLRKDSKILDKYRRYGNYFSFISFSGLILLIIGGLSNNEIISTIGLVIVAPFVVVLIVLSFVFPWLGINKALPDFEDKKIVASIIWLFFFVYCVSYLLADGDLCTQPVHSVKRC